MPKIQYIATGAALVAAAVVCVFLFRTQGGKTAALDLGMENAAAAAGQDAVTGTFSDSAVGFSFAVPSGYRAQRMLSDSGETVLVEPAAAKSADGFEIYITPYNGTAADISVQTIESEAQISVENATPVRYAGTQMGLAFTDTSSAPPLYEIWFTRGGYLFQAETWESDAALLKQALATLRLNS